MIRLDEIYIFITFPSFTGDTFSCQNKIWDLKEVILLIKSVKKIYRDFPNVRIIWVLKLFWYVEYIQCFNVFFKQKIGVCMIFNSKYVESPFGIRALYSCQL